MSFKNEAKKNHKNSNQWLFLTQLVHELEPQKMSIWLRLVDKA